MSRGFGRFPKNITLKQWWGARGIFKPHDKYCKLDIPRDRQSYEGNDSYKTDDGNEAGEVIAKIISTAPGGI